MKIISLVFVHFCFVLNLYGNQPLIDAIKQFDDANTLEELHQSLNTFERLIEINSDGWLPQYYAGLCGLNIAMVSKIEDIDKICDKADIYISKAEEYSPQNSEILCLKALSVSIRIRVDLMNRGFKYVTLSNTFLDKAYQADTLNPRVFYLKGRNCEGTPEMFGGGAENAVNLYDKALKLYELDKTDRFTIEPHWGEDLTISKLRELKENVQ